MHRRTACRIGERPRGNSDAAWLQHTREKDFFVAFSYVPIPPRLPGVRVLPRRRTGRHQCLRRRPQADSHSLGDDDVGTQLAHGLKPSNYIGRLLFNRCANTTSRTSIRQIPIEPAGRVWSRVRFSAPMGTFDQESQTYAMTVPNGDVAQLESTGFAG